MGVHTTAMPQQVKPRSGSVVYEPKGAAREYAALACNVYKGCEHRCAYCYVPEATHKTRDEFVTPAERKEFLARLEADAAKVEPGQPVLLSFTTDVYQPFDVEHGITREAIEILHRHGHRVSVLTKGGSRALRDLDLFGEGDSFGTTLTFDNDEDSRHWEPGAALPGDRIETLRRFHEAGIKTWVSFEPVIDPRQTLDLIRHAAPFVDEFKVGRWNHDSRADEIDWYQFATDVIELLESLGKPYLIKDALRPYLPDQGTNGTASSPDGTDFSAIESALAKLARGLEPDQAAVERKLRGKYISAERRLFLTRLERGQILAAYKALYGPLRKWSEFLRVIGIARRTAYDLLDTANEAQSSVCAESAQSRRKKEGSAVGYDFDTAVDKAEASLNRIFKGLTETQRQDALDILVDRLGAKTGGDVSRARPVNVGDTAKASDKPVERIMSFFAEGTADRRAA